MIVKDFSYYSHHFAHLNVNKKGGQIAPHKPLLLLAIMDLVEQGIINSNRIELTDELVSTFDRKKRILTPNVRHFKPVIGTPFFHMQYEPFWQLVPLTQLLFQHFKSSMSMQRLIKSCFS